MSRKSFKLTLAGALVAFGFGGFAVGFAWATPGAGVTVTTLAGPVDVDELNIGDQFDTHGFKIKTRGEWEARVVHYEIAPGGHTGWHSHPGPVFVMITEGTMTKYEAGQADPDVYPAGTGFVEDVHEHPHIAGNAGTTPLKLVAFFLTPKGAPIRIDHPAP